MGRRYAAEKLINTRDPVSVSPLIEALGDDDTYVIECAIKALGNIGDPRAIMPLVAQFRGEFALNAVDSLANYKDQAIEPLIVILNDNSEMQPNPKIKGYVAIALAKLGDRRAAHYLCKTICLDTSAYEYYTNMYLKVQTESLKTLQEITTDTNFSNNMDTAKKWCNERISSLNNMQ